MAACSDPATSSSSSTTTVQVRQLEEGLSGQHPDTTPRKPDGSSVPLELSPVAKMEMETRDVALRQVYFSVRDVIQVERPLSMPLMKPENFSSVVPGVYRSSYPQTQNYVFLQSLHLKTVITLVAKDLPDGFQAFMDGNEIKHQIFDMTGTKKAEIPLGTMRVVLSLIIDRSNYPLLIHCNHGKHRTGCVVGVYRRWNNWDVPSALAEYERFAAPKVRETDVNYISHFQLANLRHIMPRKVEDPPSVPRFFFLLIVVTLGLFVWLLTACNIMDFAAPPLNKKNDRS